MTSTGDVNVLLTYIGLYNNLVILLDLGLLYLMEKEMCMNSEYLKIASVSCMSHCKNWPSPTTSQLLPSWIPSGAPEEHLQQNKNTKK